MSEEDEQGPPAGEFASAQRLLEYMDANKLKALDIYERMDADGDEGVTINEIGQLLHNIGATHEVGEFDEDTINELFAMLDADGDGILTLEEFMGRVRDAELNRRKNAGGMHRRDVDEYVSVEQNAQLHEGEVEERLDNLSQENKALKQKLGEVSKALIRATADAAGAESKWSGGAAGHGVLKVSQAERNLRTVQLKTNELHVLNEVLHNKTDSVVLSQRVHQLEEAKIQAATEIKRLHEENAQLQVDLNHNDKRAQ